MSHSSIISKVEYHLNVIFIAWGFVFLTLHVLYSSLEDTSLLIYVLNLLSDHTVSCVAVEFSSEANSPCVLGAVTNKRKPYFFQGKRRKHLLSGKRNPRESPENLSTLLRVHLTDSNKNPTLVT